MLNVCAVDKALLMLISTGELLYALGVVREAQKNDRDSFNYFKRALAQFEKTDVGGPSKAKTDFKIAMHYIHRVERGLRELRRARKEPLLTLGHLKLAELSSAEFSLVEQNLTELSLARYTLPASDYSAQSRKY